MRFLCMVEFFSDPIFHLWSAIVPTPLPRQHSLSQRALMEPTAAGNLEAVAVIETERRLPRLAVMRRISTALQIQPNDYDELSQRHTAN
jgi:hypothetical protein